MFSVLDAASDKAMPYISQWWNTVERSGSSLTPLRVHHVVTIYTCRSEEVCSSLCLLFLSSRFTRALLLSSCDLHVLALIPCPAPYPVVTHTNKQRDDRIKRQRASLQQQRCDLSMYKYQSGRQRGPTKERDRDFHPQRHSRRRSQCELSPKAHNQKQQGSLLWRC